MPHHGYLFKSCWQLTIALASGQRAPDNYRTWPFACLAFSRPETPHRLRLSLNRRRVAALPSVTNHIQNLPSRDTDRLPCPWSRPAWYHVGFHTRAVTANELLPPQSPDLQPPNCFRPAPLCLGFVDYGVPQALVIYATLTDFRRSFWLFKPACSPTGMDERAVFAFANPK